MASELRASLLDSEQNDAKQNDHKGGWKSASIVLGGGVVERFAYYGIESNVVNFLTDQLQESVAAAAANVNTWVGVVYVVPLLGGFLADSPVGRYLSILIFSLLYVLGLGLLTLSAAIISQNAWNSETEVGILVFVSLYIVALSQGYKVSLLTFGADQFDSREKDHQAEKTRAKSSFFNWWSAGLCVGAVAANLSLHYIQDNIGWVVSFGIPCLAMVVALALFLLGNPWYRFPPSVECEESTNPRMIAQQGAHASSNATFLQHLAHYKVPKYVIKLLPIWITCLSYTIAHAQTPTLFIKQATTVDRSIGPNVIVPSATLKTFVTGSMLLFVAIYDRVLVPVARRVTGYPSGITMLQRLGAGIALTILNMVIAALVEKRRLEIARAHGLIDIPNAVVPMSFWWLVPQFIFNGLGDAFAEVGMKEFFYDQVPKEMRGIGLSLCYVSIGIGSFLSSFLVWVIDWTTTENGDKQSWFSDNLNKAHLDYFYWLLAGISAAGFVVFLLFSKSYDYDLGEEEYST